MQVAIVSTKPGTKMLASRLHGVGIRTQTCSVLSDVSELIDLFELDLVLVDDGFGGTAEKAVRALRGLHKTIPVVVFGSRRDREFSLACFSAGADDMVVWPGDAEIIAARVRAIVRRCRGADTAALRIGPLSFDMIRRSLHVDGMPLSLTNKEYDVLEYMVTRKGVVLAKDALLNQLYGGKDAPDGRIIDVFVCKLRKKLACYGVHELIETVRGLGYMLNERTCRFTGPSCSYDEPTPAAA